MELIHAAVHKVGDSAGWTTIGNFDYKKWSATKTFQVQDIIRKFITLFTIFTWLILPFYGCFGFSFILWVLIFHINHNFVS